MSQLIWLFRYPYHPPIAPPSMNKSSGRTRAFREATKRRNRTSIAADRSNHPYLPFFDQLHWPFRLPYDPPIVQPSLYKSSAWTRAFSEATKNQNRASIEAERNHRSRAYIFRCFHHQLVPSRLLIYIGVYRRVTYQTNQKDLIKTM